MLLGLRYSEGWLPVAQGIVGFRAIGLNGTGLLVQTLRAFEWVSPLLPVDLPRPAQPDRPRSNSEQIRRGQHLSAEPLD